MKVTFLIDERTEKGKKIADKIRSVGFFWWHRFLEPVNRALEDEFKLTEEETKEFYFEVEGKNQNGLPSEEQTTKDN